MAVTAALSIPLTALVVYLILWKSPKPMRIYKFLLLNISVWAFITDMLLEIISLPLPVLEVFGLYSVGLSRSLPSPVGFASVVATMFCIFEYLVGLLFAFYHRYYVLQDEFMKALAVQTVAPLLLYAVPLFTLSVCLIFKFDIVNGISQHPFVVMA
ncbi:hypothetical protein QR680_015596 [Steinernema hermaphroditum]|uniref:G protein-coupled receptor n=1 Tax=Steinernema hermaphroditum TaxID=289476 RepID=A0AA39H9B7_9BILA|nr:hypothetical protein QR680_015596 [Steinernema hermaphroditum]